MRAARRNVLTAALALVTCPAMVAARPPLPRKVHPREPLPLGDIPEGAWRLLMLSGQPIYVKRLRAEAFDASAWVVLSGTCPHAGCTVEPGFGVNGGLGCPCHGSRFDERGSLQRGPAPRGLTIPRHVIEAEVLTLW